MTTPIPEGKKNNERVFQVEPKTLKDNALNDELTINLRSRVTHESPMSDEARVHACAASKPLIDRLKAMLMERGYSSDSIAAISEDEVELQGIPQSLVHTFVLQAEELGKHVTYEKTLTIKFSDKI